jgi:deoxycytidine triphosphate deaminase
MLLSRREIQSAVERGEIVFDPPLEDDQWGEASVDLRLGFSFTKLNPTRGIKISVAQGLAGLPGQGLWTTVQKKRVDALGKAETFTLEPGEFVLAMTYEKGYRAAQLDRSGGRPQYLRSSRAQRPPNRSLDPARMAR